MYEVVALSSMLCGIGVDDRVSLAVEASFVSSWMRLGATVAMASSAVHSSVEYTDLSCHDTESSDDVDRMPT